MRRCSVRAAAGLVALMLAGPAEHVAAQGRAGGAPVQRTARQVGQTDFTGTWVSFVTEDWRFRMVTPRKGDYARVPLTPLGRKTADGWNPAADVAAGNQCRAFGAANIMRVPGRFRIGWQDDETLKVDADAGTQTRLLRFKETPPPAERTWQGHSIARWDANGHSISVVTTGLRAGYLRFNGVPYSENARLTEHFDLTSLGDSQLLIITTIVDDPQYLQRPFITSSHFKRETDASKWNPTPCTSNW